MSDKPTYEELERSTLELEKIEFKRQIALDALQESEEKYRTLHESMMDAFVSVDMDGNIQEFNNEYIRMLGYPFNEIIKLKYNDLTPDKWHEFEAKIVEEQILKKGYSDIYEKEYIKKDGTIFPVELRVFLIKDKQRNPVGMWAIVRDITERKQVEQALRKSEKKFRFLYEHSPLAYQSCDENGHLLEVNQAWLDLLAYSKEEVIGRWFGNFLTSDYLEKLEEKFTYFKEHGEIHDVEHEMVCKDGSCILISSKGKIAYDEHGKFKQTHCIFQDITERKRMEKALCKAHDELERRVEERTVELIEINKILEQEIAERKLAEEQLLQSRENQHILLSNIQTQVWYLTDDHTYGAVNQAHAEFNGVRIEDMAFRDLYDIFPKDIAEVCREGNIEVFKTGQTVRTEEWVPHVSGERRLISIVKSPKLDSNGNVDTVVCSAEDITERKRAEEEIQRNYDIQKVINSLLRVSMEDTPLDEILKHALDLIHSIPRLSIDSRGSIFLVEDDPEELIMKVQNRCEASIQRGCSRVPFGRCLCGRAALMQEIQFADHLNGQHDTVADGCSFPHGHYCVPILLHKRTVGVINVCLKEGHLRSHREERLLSIISDTLASIIMRKQFEEQILESKFMLQAVFDGISEPLVLLNKEMTAEILNKPAREYYKIEDQSAIGNYCYQAFRGRSEPCEGCNIPSAVLNGKYSHFERKGFMDPDKIENVALYPVQKMDSKAKYAILRINDITKQRKMEQELAQADKMISLGVLVSGVAHEINNPNNFIMLNAPLLWKSWKHIVPILEKHYEENGDFNMAGLPYSEMRDEIPNLFSGIETGSNRIKKIVHDLKDFARQEPSAMDQSVDVNKVVKDSINLVDSLIWKSTNKFKIEYGRNLPTIKGNKQKLEQVIINLIQNACQALSDKGEGIFVASFYDAARNGIIVEVCDEGAGIPDEVLPNIMDPFFTTKRSTGGIGLGLAVSGNIVREHGGRIEVKSERGIGTTFTVFLPITGIEKSAKILVVDDEDVVRMTIMQALGGERTYIIDEASNGTEACIKLGKDRPDLLIIDVMMPDMDGVEVCRLIKKDPELSGIKVIVITGYPDSSKVKEIAEMGFKNIILKPLRIPGFTKMVDMVLKGEDIKSMVGFG
jgi:PAS domain S-box-containing protein